jgi:amidase
MGLAALPDIVTDGDSITVERLEATGAVIVGTTKTPELDYIIKTGNPSAGATPTLFDSGRSAGDSSGNSAATLPTGAVPLAIG